MRRPILILTMTHRKLLIGLAACLFLALGIILQGQPTSIPMSSTMVGETDDNLKTRVEALAKQYNTQPIDAKNDRVWKAIPGLNGIRVDVQATIKKARANTDGRIPLVVEQIPPKVSLDQLGALPIYRGNQQKKQMALMINVAWGTEYIPDMLDQLDHYQVKATFFLDGSWTKKNGDVAKRLVQRGHEIGNHAYNHPNMGKLDAHSQLTQIQRTNDAIKRATSVSPKLFAPPGGAYNDTTVQVAHNQKMRTILWTLDTLDWRRPPAATIIDKVLSRAENGALVLMHPTEPTRDALRTIIPALQKRGYGLVPVSQLLDPTRPLQLK